MKHIAIIIMVVIAVITSGCNIGGSESTAVVGAKAGKPEIAKVEKVKAPETLTAEQAEEALAIVKVIQAQFTAFEKEDLDGVAATLHTDARSRGATLELASAIFDNLDGLGYDLAGYEYLGEGVINVEQLTIGPEDFRENTVKSVWTFKKDGDAWKLYKSKVKSIEYADGIDEDGGSWKWLKSKFKSKDGADEEEGLEDPTKPTAKV